MSNMNLYASRSGSSFVLRLCALFRACSASIKHAHTAAALLNVSVTSQPYHIGTLTYPANPAMAAVIPWPARRALILEATSSDMGLLGSVDVALAFAASRASVDISAIQATE